MYVSPALLAFSTRPPTAILPAVLAALTPYRIALEPSYALSANLPTPVNAPTTPPAVVPTPGTIEPIAASAAADVATSVAKLGTDEPKA